MLNSPLKLSLSSKGLQRVDRDLYEKDFKFVVGGTPHFCPSFIAEFLSPRVSHLRTADASVSELQLELEDPNHYFSQVLSLGFGFSVEIPSEKATFFRSVCEELWNVELFDSIPERDGQNLDREDLISRVSLLCQIPSMFDDRDSYLALLASRFHEFSASDCLNLNSSVLEAIISHPSLVIQSEDLSS
jgi:hypothetical protein